MSGGGGGGVSFSRRMKKHTDLFLQNSQATARAFLLIFSINRMPWNECELLWEKPRQLRAQVEHFSHSISHFQCSISISRSASMEIEIRSLQARQMRITFGDVEQTIEKDIRLPIKNKISS